MTITNEELENYLELWEKTEGDKITVNRELFLTLATTLCRFIAARSISLYFIRKSPLYLDFLIELCYNGSAGDLSQTLSPHPTTDTGSSFLCPSFFASFGPLPTL